ncbi:MAG TPA: apolipoprotein N-acyltransferase [Thermoanaerobaculia bacterium]|nr:apolipoprotein N-acyltransferase [Thermoanaerobaculia bacterium]HUM31126.1 apolipoprotein N-acyltransferase [Thermoanaerobaculia bacterium]HXK69475.1 apolipoprotein N-acyltransferase [Thermoanaerobaculia bacterium]
MILLRFLLFDIGLGILFALPFHFSFLTPLLVIVPALFWWMIRRRPPGGRWVHVLLFGSAYQAIALLWIVHVLKVFGGMGPFAGIPALLALSGYLALFLTAAVMVAEWVSGEKYLETLPLTFFLFELLRGYLFRGFPWNGWAQPLADHAPLMQSAAWIGAAGLSACILWLSTLPLLGKRKALAGSLFLTILLVGGIVRYMTWNPEGETLAVVAIQPSIDEAARYHGEHVDAWTPSRELAQPFLYGGSDLIVFPESVVLEPFYTRGDVVAACKRWAEEGVDIFMNGNLVARNGDWTNAAILFSRGKEVAEYSKINLVPFGEYLPLRSLFERLGFTTIARSLSDFTRGNQVGVLSGRTVYGISICYEIVFSSMVRQQVSRGATLLVTLTNDGWYGNLGADRQHVQQALFRTVEYDRPLVRAALTGISCLANGRGDVLASLDTGERGGIMESLPTGTRFTIYYWIGPFLPWVVLFILVVLMIRRKLNVRSQHNS